MASTESIGHTVGHLHNVTDKLARRYDLPSDTPESLVELLPYAFEFMEPRDVNLAVAAAEWGRSKMVAWSRKVPEYGICHADLAGVNIRLHPAGGITLFDFGASRYTWRICDFLRFHPGDSCSRESQARWDAFRRGYSAARAIPDKVDELLPIYRLMRHLKGMGRSSGTCRLRMGIESPKGFLPSDIESLRKQVQGIAELRDYLGARGLL